MYATSDRAKNQLATGELPPLANPIPELDQYNLILVGSPVWSGQPAVPVKQFLNQLTNFAGHLAPFYTDAGVANTLPEDAGAASGLINTMHQIGSSVGLALIVGVTGGMTHGGLLIVNHY